MGPRRCVAASRSLLLGGVARRQLRDKPREEVVGATGLGPDTSLAAELTHQTLAAEQCRLQPPDLPDREVQRVLERDDVSGVDNVRLAGADGRLVDGAVTGQKRFARALQAEEKQSLAAEERARAAELGIDVDRRFRGEKRRRLDVQRLVRERVMRDVARQRRRELDRPGFGGGKEPVRKTSADNATEN
jgi:hypothetical protein